MRKTQFVETQRERGTDTDLYEAQLQPFHFNQNRSLPNPPLKLTKMMVVARPLNSKVERTRHPHALMSGEESNVLREECLFDFRAAEELRAAI